MLFTHQDKNNASIKASSSIFSNNNRTNNNIGVFSLNRIKPTPNINRITNIRAINGLLPINTEPIPHKKDDIMLINLLYIIIYIDVYI